MASLIARRSPHDAVRSACDAHYLAWRFDSPLSSYRFVYCGASTLKGFVVLETPDDPERDRVRIVLWEAQDEALRSRLLRIVVEAGQFADLRLWGQGLTALETQALEGMQFCRPAMSRPSPHHLSLLVMDLAPTEVGPALPEIGGWRLRMIDSDKC
jgi:hypothetical protein